MKIAIPVKDENLEIFPKTGKAPYFAIFHDFTFSHLVKNLVEDHQEDENNPSIDHIAFHRKQVNNIEDVDAVLVILIGKHIKKALEEKNIKIVEFSQSDFKNAQELVQAYLNYKQ